MIRMFANPYIIFYPTVSRDGMQFPINKTLRDIQGRAYKEEYAWRGNIVVAKYRDNPFTSMIDASMADFPILKNYFLTHGSPRQVGSSIYIQLFPVFTKYRRPEQIISLLSVPLTCSTPSYNVIDDNSLIIHMDVKPITLTSIR